MTETTVRPEVIRLADGWVSDTASKNVLWVSEPHPVPDGGGYRELLRIGKWKRGEPGVQVLRIETAEVWADDDAALAAEFDYAAALDVDSDEIDWANADLPAAALQFLGYAIGRTLIAAGMWDYTGRRLTDAWSDTLDRMPSPCTPVPQETGSLEHWVRENHDPDEPPAGLLADMREADQR